MMRQVLCGVLVAAVALLVVAFAEAFLAGALA